MKHGHCFSVPPARANAAAEDNEYTASTITPRTKRVRRFKEAESNDDASANMNGHYTNGNASYNGLNTSPMSLRSATRQATKIVTRSHHAFEDHDGEGDGDEDDDAIHVAAGDSHDVMSPDPAKASSEPERSSQSSGSSGTTSSFPPNGHLILKLNLNKTSQTTLNGSRNKTVQSIETSTKIEEEKSVSPAAGEAANDGTLNINAGNSSPEKDRSIKVSPSAASVDSAIDPHQSDRHHHHLRETPFSRRVSPRATTREVGTATPTSVASRSNGNGNGNGRGRATSRGRARGGRRAVNGAARGNGAGRGRYPRNGRGRGGRLQSADPEVNTSSIPAVRSLKERQRELERVFRHVSQVQRSALSVLASRSEEQLIKDPNAHKKCLEWAIVQNEIDKRLQRRIEWLETERDLCLKEENILFEGNKRRIHDWSKVSSMVSFPPLFLFPAIGITGLMLAQYHTAHIQRDLFLAAQGEFVCRLEELLCNKSPLSESDSAPLQHGESTPSDDDTEPLRRTFVRGFNSANVRKVETARLVDVAMERWGWLKQLIKDPNEFQEVLEVRLLEIKEQDEKQAEAEKAKLKAEKTEAEAARSMAMFDSLAQVCSNQLDTIEEAKGVSKDDLTALANIATNEKPDSGKSSEETLIAEGISSEEKIEEERYQHGRVIERRYSHRTRRSIDEGRRARLAEEPRSYQLPPPAHITGHPPEQQPIPPPQQPPPMYHHPHAPPPILPPPPPSHYRPGMQLAPLHYLEETKHHMPPSQPMYPYHHPPPMAPPPPLAIPENPPPQYRINNPHQRVILPQPGSALAFGPVSAPLPPTTGPPPPAHFAPIPLPPPGVLYPPHHYPANGHHAPVPPPQPPPPPSGEHERRPSLTGRRLLPDYTHGPPQPHTAPAGAQA
ncbi:hypothetical protein KEM54_002352, partial [Ascosphaera aggregata]